MQTQLRPVPSDGSGPEDLILVRAALRGERDAVDGLLERLGCAARFVYRLNRSLGYGLHAEALEDVVQQVYMAVWSRLPDFVGTAALESWVYGFCRNCLHAEVRRRARRQRVATVVPEELDQRRVDADRREPALQADGQDVLLDELARLSPIEREVVHLRHLQGWSFEQIARHQQLPASTVKDRCYRALTKLKGRLKRRDVHA